MNRQSIPFSLSIALFVATTLPAQGIDPSPAPFTAGGAVVDITPAPGISLNGSISKPGRAAGVHDPLMVRAAVIESGGERVAVAIVDACFLGFPVFETAARLVAEATGIPASHQLVAATHTHAAPRGLSIGRLSELDDTWHAELPLHIADAIVRADSVREPAQLRAGALSLPELVASRRFHSEPGTVPPNPFGETGETVASVFGRGAEKIEAAGPIDPAFGVLYATRPDGSPLLLIGNFGVHYCGGYQGGLMSADYFGAFCRSLEKKLAGRTGGRPFTALHSNGTSGDIGALGTPPEMSERRFAPFEKMAVVGDWLAMRIAAEMDDFSLLAPGAVGGERRVLELGVRRPVAQRLDWARRVIEEEDAPGNRLPKIYADSAIHLAAYPPTIGIPVQVLRIGRMRLASTPCEMFAETGLAIKAARGDAPVFTVSLANGYGGYLPTAEQHNYGGYETWAARSSFLEESAEAEIRATLVEMVKRE